MKGQNIMFNKVPTDLNFVSREKVTLDFWKENQIFEKSLNQRSKDNTYTFYDGPPTANGKPHIGHVLTRVIKDMIPRYHAMKGAYVPRKAGWDTHGLPVELEASTARSRSRSTASPPSSASVRNPFGSTRVCGSPSPTPLASGLT